jgi:epoxyqueuosine reductase QueG
MEMSELSRMVRVCDKCLRACCWQGMFVCDHARYAGPVELPVSVLIALKREHPDHFSEEAVRRNCG